MRFFEASWKILAVVSASALLILLVVPLTGASFKSATWGVFMLCGTCAAAFYLMVKLKRKRIR